MKQASRHLEAHLTLKHRIVGWDLLWRSFHAIIKRIDDLIIERYTNMFGRLRIRVEILCNAPNAINLIPVIPAVIPGEAPERRMK